LLVLNDIEINPEMIKCLVCNADGAKSIFYEKFHLIRRKKEIAYLKAVSSNHGCFYSPLCAYCLVNNQIPHTMKKK